jgi:hypothetical protein
MNRLAQLQAWYDSHCDGEWEHVYGIKIDSLDNPGWWVKIDLAGTELEKVSFDPRLERQSEVDWLDCKVKDKIFDGAGDPSKLETILALFLDWQNNIGAWLFKGSSTCLTAGVSPSSSRRHETLSLRCLSCTCVGRFERTDECLAAISGTYAGADMAGASA